MIAVRQTSEPIRSRAGARRPMDRSRRLRRITARGAGLHRQGLQPMPTPNYCARGRPAQKLSLIHISEPTRLALI
eukprot:6812563-Alexandrium_andersonii.AAC.1